MTDYERWITRNVPDMAGKVVVITGANSGLGFQEARVQAGKGACVVLAVRNTAKGDDAARRIQDAVPTADLEVMTLDLADLASIGRFAETFRANHNRLDRLINNAGVMIIPYRKTTDGFEMQFGTNHLGHFALTGLLLPLILKTPGARVATMSSGAHMFGRINFDDLQGERSYSKWGAYCQSKLANLLFAYELQRKLDAARSDVISVAAHPGYAATNLQTAGAKMEGSTLGEKAMTTANRVFAQSAEMGALPMIYAAASPDVLGGDYIGPGGLLGQSGFPKKVTSNGRSHDIAAAARLWAVSEKLTGVSYAFS